MTSLCSSFFTGKLSLPKKKLHSQILFSVSNRRIPLSPFRKIPLLCQLNPLFSPSLSFLSLPVSIFLGKPPLPFLFIPSASMGSPNHHHGCYSLSPCVLCCSSLPKEAPSPGPCNALLFLNHQEKNPS